MAEAPSLGSTGWSAGSLLAEESLERLKVKAYGQLRKDQSVVWSG